MTSFFIPARTRNGRKWASLSDYKQKYTTRGDQDIRCMGLHIHSSVKKITNAQYIHVSNDRSWLNRSKHTTYYGKRNTWILRKFSSVQSLSHVWIFVTPWAGALQASLFITNSQSLLKLISIKSVMPSNHLIFCWLLLLRPSIFPSIRVFSNESFLHIRWPKYWSVSISPFSALEEN